MAISTVTNTSALSQTPTTTPTTGDSSVLGKDAFMKLLVAQLKNQDPLNPTDSKEFVTQLSQLTSVEQMTTMTSSLTSLQSATTSLVNNQASNLVGKHVEGDGKTLYLGDSGTADTAINVGSAAKSVEVTVRDSTGAAVFTQDLGKTNAGTVPFSWAGLDSTGTRAATGKYTVSVIAKNDAGNPVTADAKISGLVSAVSYARGFPELMIGTSSVALANITEISN